MGNLHIFVEGFEVWRDVPGHGGCYQVSDHGRVPHMAYLYSTEIDWLEKAIDDKIEKDKAARA